MNADSKMALFIQELIAMLLLNLTTHQIIKWTAATYKMQTFRDIG